MTAAVRLSPPYAEPAGREDKQPSVIVLARHLLPTAVFDALSQRSCSISELAELLGTTFRALRYYEAKGLVVPIRTRGLARVYPPNTALLAAVVVELRKAGISLSRLRYCLQAEKYAQDELALELRSQFIIQTTRVEILKSLLTKFDVDGPG